MSSCFHLKDENSDFSYSLNLVSTEFKREDLSKICLFFIERMRKPRESVHKDRKNDSLPMEDLKQPQISINNSGFDNLDHSLQHAAEYEEMHGSQAEDVYETINNATCNEQRYQTLDKHDGTATYQNIAS